MLRNVLERRSEVLDNPSTPLRGGVVDFPRIRLVDRQSKLNPVPIYTLSTNKVRGTISLGINLGSSNPGHWCASGDCHRYFSVADRFIPQRRHRIIDAVNYNLKKDPPLTETRGDEDLDIFAQIKSLGKSWRKMIMENAMAKANVIPGLSDQRIFNFADRENREPISDVPSHRCWFDIPGRSKARNRPLIGRSEFTIKARPSARSWPVTLTIWYHDGESGFLYYFHFHTFPITAMTGSLDWGARNFIAVAVDRPTGSSILIFDPTTSNIGTITQPVQELDEIAHRITVIKWNHAGDRIAVITRHSELRVYSLEKLCWMRKCACTEDSNETNCGLVIVAWTYSDNTIVTCCRENRISSYSCSGECTQTFIPDLHADAIISIGFSLDDRYFAFTTLDSVRVHTWPDFTPFLLLGPAPGGERFMSLAWHPWDINVLCIGGSPYTNALSLWDIQRHKLLCWKQTTAGVVVDEVTWNKLSGELVVRFDYKEENDDFSIVAVLSSFERIVDVVYSGHQCYDLIWSPDHTQLATGRGGHVKVWNFFGNETRKWREAEEKKEEWKKKSYLLKRRRAIFTDQTRHLEHYDIR